MGVSELRHNLAASLQFQVPGLEAVILFEATYIDAQDKSQFPKIDHEHCLVRSRLIDHVQVQSRNFTRNICFLARSGQGKTLAAAQMIPRLPGPFLWYNVTDGDREPLSFMDSLCRLFADRMDAFSVDAVMLLAGAESGGRFEQWGSRLAQELERGGQTGFHLFLDDVQMLHGSTPGCRVLGALAKSPLKLVLMTNKPLPGVVTGLEPSGYVVIGNNDLAMTKSEISIFFNRNLRVPVSVSEVNRIYQVTEGWIRGVMSLKDTIGMGKNLRRKTDGAASSPAGLSMAPELDYFFSDEMTASLNDRMIRHLTVLSEFPKVIPGLSSVLTGDRQIDAQLESLTEKICFIRKSNGTFVFHPFLRQYLKQNATGCFPASERKKVLVAAASWFESCGNYPESIRYYLKAGAYDRADRLFEEKGLELYSENQVFEISDELTAVSDRVLRIYPNLSLCMGIYIAESNPDAALVHFQQAAKRFDEDGNIIGLLTVLTFQIRYHVIVDRRYDRIDALLRELESNVRACSGETPASLRLYIDLAVLEAKAVTNCAFNNIEWQNRQRVALQRRGAFNNSFVRLILMGMDRHIAWCDYSALCNDMERLYPMIHSGRVNPFNKMMIHVYALRISFLSGYRLNYLYFRNIIVKTTKKSALESSNCDKEMGLQEILCHLSKNEFYRALELIDGQLRGMASERDAHYISQLLQYKAYISGVNGNKSHVRKYAETSRELRRQIGGQFYVLLNHLAIGGAYSHVGDVAAGELHLGEAIDRAIGLNIPYLRVLAHFHRAYLRLNARDSRGFEADFREGMALLLSKKFSDYFLWVPEIVLREIFSAAVRKKIEVESVRKIASRRLKIAFVTGGEVIPRLQICALGRFHILCDGNEIASAGDLTRIQLEILSILISSPGQKTDLDELQLVFWPESTGKKGRANLNVALNRLRSALKSKITQGDIKNYIRVKNGRLMLEHCDTDVQNFIFFAKKGIAFFRSGKMWQAANMFRMAHTYYKGAYMPCVILSDRDTDFKENTLLPLYYETIEKWCDIILSEIYDNDEDMVILEHSIGEILNNHELVIKLYRIYTCFGKTVKAALIVKQYRKLLERDGFTDDEVREAMAPVLEEVERCKKNVIFE